MLHIVILAAGLGTRMKSDLPKVLHPILGLPMVAWILNATQALKLPTQILLITGHGADQVERTLTELYPDKNLKFVRQDRPLGTGHALQCALPDLPEQGPVLVLAGDTPLVRPDALQKLAACANTSPAVVASFEVPDPTGYGRIVRSPQGISIVEQAHATAEQKAICEVNSGAYLFEAALLKKLLPTLKAHYPKGPNQAPEYYLTDLIQSDATVLPGFDAQDWQGVNDRAALSGVRRTLAHRVNHAWALKGVDFDDFTTNQIDAQVVLYPGAHIGMGTILQGKCEIAGDVGPYCVLKDTQVVAGAHIKTGTVADGAHVEGDAGPLAHLRPGAILRKGSKVGNFVEVKNATLHPNAKASHLTYLGDAEIGAEANIGAGTITCNYDGFGKHRTRIGAGAFIGSNSALVAPVEIGEGAIVGAGSTITENIPNDAIAVVRAPLKLNEGSAVRLRARLKARAQAAKLARQGEK